MVRAFPHARDSSVTPVGAKFEAKKPEKICDKSVDAPKHKTYSLAGKKMVSGNAASVNGADSPHFYAFDEKAEDTRHKSHKTPVRRRGTGTSSPCPAPEASEGPACLPAGSEDTVEKRLGGGYKRSSSPAVVAKGAVFGGDNSFGPPDGHTRVASATGRRKATSPGKTPGNNSTDDSSNNNNNNSSSILPNGQEYSGGACIGSGRGRSATIVRSGQGRKTSADPSNGNHKVSINAASFGGEEAHSSSSSMLSPPHGGATTSGGDSPAASQPSYMGATAASSARSASPVVRKHAELRYKETMHEDPAPRRPSIRFNAEMSFSGGTDEKQKRSGGGPKPSLFGVLKSVPQSPPSKKPEPAPWVKALQEPSSEEKSGKRQTSITSNGGGSEQQGGSVGKENGNNNNNKNTSSGSQFGSVISLADITQGRETHGRFERRNSGSGVKRSASPVTVTSLDPDVNATRERQEKAHIRTYNNNSNGTNSQRSPSPLPSWGVPAPSSSASAAAAAAPQERSGSAAAGGRRTYHQQSQRSPSPIAWVGA